MFGKVEGKNYLYYDSTSQDFSNLAAGLLIKSIGSGYKTAYVDFNNSSKKLTNFIENLSLSSSFTKYISRFQIDIFNQKNKDIVSKTITPLVEYFNITTDMFYKQISDYDLIIFDNLDLNKLDYIKIVSLIKNKNFSSQIVFITNNINDYNKLKNEVKIKTQISTNSNKNLISVKDLVNIYGQSVGKSLYAYGLIIRRFLYKNDVKIVYFDKIEDISGDILFFKILKKWQIENSFYGTFDFVLSGIKSREVDEKILKKESQDSLMLLETAMKKQSPVLADELLDVIYKGLVDKNQVIKILKQTKAELIITGNNFIKEISEISSQNIDFKLDE